MPRSRLHTAFEIGIILKGLNALLELIGGVLLLAFSRSAIQTIVLRLTVNELNEDPRDFVATRLRAAAAALSAGGKTLAALYLLSHGIIKLWLIYELLRGRRRAYPWAIAVFALFGIYQMYRYVLRPSGWLIALTVLDVVVIALTIAEWRRLDRAARA